MLLVQAALVGLIAYAAYRQWLYARRDIKRQGGVLATVKRGEQGWSYLNLAYGITSILLIQIISVSEALKGHKVALSLADLSALVYLFFYNGWFRNKTIEMINKSKQLEEKF